MLFALVVACVVGAPDASSLPAGRAWTPYTQMVIPGSTDYLGVPLLDRDERGVPYFVLQTHWDTSAVHRMTTFSWQDTAWRCAINSPIPSGFFNFFVTQPGEARGLTWLTYQLGDIFSTWAVVARLMPDSIATPDTAFQTTTQSTEYAAAASTRRRWVIRSEYYNRDFENNIRVAYSDTARIWHEVTRLGVNEDQCTVAPLGDTTAMVVYAGLSGLEYAILDGSSWSETGNIDPRPFTASHPELRLRRSGGLWLFWSDNDWIHMSTYRGGAWERGDSLRCLLLPGETFTPAFLDVEQDTTEYPSIAWTNFAYGSTWRDVTAIAFGNGHGWDAGEEIANSEQSGWAPTLTHDLNGDVWFIWRSARQGINRWTHTYCSATCPAPVVTANGEGTRVSWALSSRAPDSRWTLFRAEGDGAFDSLATVRAGADSVLGCDDPTAQPGRTWRYRIRRESLDTRYQWTSEVAVYWQTDTRTPIGLTLANPVGAQLTFRLTGATGTLWARMYDLQGRVVLQKPLRTGGTGDDAFTLDLAGTGAGRAGIFFLRITDSTGRTTPTARVAVVR